MENWSFKLREVIKMYGEKPDSVVKEDEEIYGDNFEIIDKKTPIKRVYYSDIFD